MALTAWKWFLRALGAWIVIHETLSDFDRPLLLLIAAACLGLADLSDSIREWLSGGRR